MKGMHVERKFGWDCHGLPIEYEIDKKYEIKSSVDRENVLNIGINSY
jgi:isoleucyl-tRNA synthetase